MASDCIYGKPAGGKSFWTTRQILAELLTTERLIVTNVVLRVEAWVPYLVSIGYPNIDFYSRVLLIGTDNMKINPNYCVHDDEWVKDFWRFRPGCILPSISTEDIKAEIRPEIDVSKGGVRYFLDELHEHLNSRQWMKTGPLMLWYIAKHRHFGDDVTWITQAVANVDKQWRSVTQQYTLVRNYGMEKFRGLRKGNYFEAVTFLDFDPAEKLTPQSSERFKLDLNVANLYYTSVKGGSADKGRKIKGLHVWWIYAAVIFVGALVALFFMFGPKWIGEKMSAHNVDVNAHRHNLVPSAPVHPVSRGGAPLDTPDLATVARPSPTPDVFQVAHVNLSHTPASQVLQAFGDQKDVGGMIADAGDSGVIISGTSIQRMVGLVQMVKDYDQSQRLVVVNAVIGRVETGKSRDVGLYDLMSSVAHASSQGSDGGALSLAFQSMTVDLATGIASFGGSVAATAVLQAVTSFRDEDFSFHVFSRPSIAVLSGATGTFQSGRQIPVPITTRDATGSSSSVDYRNADFSVTVSPSVLADGTVRLSVDQQDTQVVSTSTVAGSQVPTLSTQSVKTRIDLRPDQVAFIGGISTTTDNRDSDGVPFLYRVPVVGLLLGHHSSDRESSRLVVLLSAHVVPAGQTSVSRHPVVPVVTKPVMTSQHLRSVPLWSRAFAWLTKGNKNQRKETVR